MIKQYGQYSTMILVVLIRGVGLCVREGFNVNQNFSYLIQTGVDHELNVNFFPQVDALKTAISRDSKQAISLLEKRIDSLEEAMSKQFADIRQALIKPRVQQRNQVLR
jgi:hypothetical protein